jgi:cyanophycin synthetase
MKLGRQRFLRLRKALEQVDPDAFGLSEVELYPGASRYSRQSSVICHLGRNADDIAKRAAEEAAALIASKIGIQVGHGVCAEEDRLACWVEYFPGGSGYGRASFALQALQAAFLVVATAESPDEQCRRLANAELEKLQKIPMRPIDVQSQFLVAAARRADIPINNVGGSSHIWQFGWGIRSDIFFLTASTGDAVPGHQATRLKHITKLLFQEIGLPTPDWRLLSPQDEAMNAAEAIGWPCVVKPLDQAFGTGITADIADADVLERAVAAARKYSSTIMIEAHEPGWDHRLMVVDGRLMGAVRREPPCVTGDGRSSVDELVAELNRSRGGQRENAYLLPVQRDAALHQTLAGLGLSLESVLPEGRRLVLRSVANFSTGGSSVNVTAEVHPQVRGMAELLAAATGLRTAGIDYITTDISRSHDEVGGGFIEVNAVPRLRLLMSGGIAEEEVGSALLGELPGRIPATLLIGPKEAVPALKNRVAERVAPRGNAAAVSAGWAQIGAVELPVARLDAFSAVSAVLRHRTVSELTILWSLQDVEEFGLPVDQLQRAIVVAEGLSDTWLSVLRALCEDVVLAADSAAALDESFPGTA